MTIEEVNKLVRGQILEYSPTYLKMVHGGRFDPKRKFTYHGRARGKDQCIQVKPVGKNYTDTYHRDYLQLAES